MRKSTVSIASGVTSRDGRPTAFIHQSLASACGRYRTRAVSSTQLHLAYDVRFHQMQANALCCSRARDWMRTRTMSGPSTSRMAKACSKVSTCSSKQL